MWKACGPGGTLKTWTEILTPSRACLKVALPTLCPCAFRSSALADFGAFSAATSVQIDSNKMPSKLANLIMFPLLYVILTSNRYSTTGVAELYLHAGSCQAV